MTTSHTGGDSEPRFTLQIDHRLIDCDASHRAATNALQLARIHGPDVRTIDALEETLARVKAAERDFIQVHKNCIEARERAEKAESALARLTRSAEGPISGRMTSVPKEATPEMIEAAVHACDGMNLSRMGRRERARFKAAIRWKAMLAAAPAPMQPTYYVRHPDWEPLMKRIERGIVNNADAIGAYDELYHRLQRAPQSAIAPINALAPGERSSR